MGKMYKVLHRQIDGAIMGRENGWPDLLLEMRPIGTELPLSEQSRELRITIGKTTTVLNADGINELIEFTKQYPQ